uniref:Uncharacterized protein n=1 Tax=viral metagenome TaxID=1070528 RepID=A0A6C0KTX6_9ZZZZ
MSEFSYHKTEEFHVPAMTRSFYVNTRETMRLKEQKENNNELDCPILFTPITMEAVASKRAISIAKFGQNGIIIGMNFVSAVALTEWFKTRQSHPLTNQPLGINPLALRAKYATDLLTLEELHLIEASKQFDLTPEQVQELFPIFLKESETFQHRFPLEHAWMQCHLKMGDTGIHTTFDGTAGEQRVAAMAFLADKSVGTGVFRLSSIQSTNLVECFAISYVLSAQKTAIVNGQTVVIQAANIRHVAVIHVMGYGYAMIGAQVGQKLPEMDADGHSNGVSLPSYDRVWASLLDLLMYLRMNAVGFDLSRMVLHQ